MGDSASRRVRVEAWFREYYSGVAPSKEDDYAMSEDDEEFTGQGRKEVIHQEVIGDEMRAEDIPQTYFFAQDAELMKTVRADPELTDLQPLYSPLTRLTKINDKEKKAWQIAINLMKGNTILNMERSDYNEGNKWRKLEANALFLKTVINDSHKGFKMTLLSRLRKEIVLSREKKQGWREKLRGGQ